MVACLFVVDQLVHAAWTEGGAYGVDDSHAGVDVADELGLALTGVRALFEQDDLGLLWWVEQDALAAADDHPKDLLF